MKLKAWLLTLAVSTPLQLGATVQRPDELVLDGTTYPLYTDAFYGLTIDPNLLKGPSTGTTCTSNWRGYAATWTIDKDQLRLIHVRAGSCGTPSLEVPLKSIFPSATSSVPATWFSGELHLALGEPSSNGISGHPSYERFLVLTVSNGRVTKREERDADAMFLSGKPRTQLPSGFKCKSFEYPPEARMASAQGRVRLRVLVGNDSSIETVEIEQSAGSSREHKLLDKASIAQARSCVYSGDSAVEKGWYPLEYKWSLH